MSDSLRHKTLTGVYWSAMERFSVQGVSFILGIFIARQLSPSDYGVIAMLSIFFAISGAFVDSGFSSALIRKIDRTESDTSTVFYFNIAVGFTASLICFLLAPIIANFFNAPILISVTRILSVTIFIGSFGTVQQALLTSKMDFSTQAKISLITTIISGCLGLWGAYKGLGVWALVIQKMSVSFLQPALLWVMVKWRPTMPFSKDSFKQLFGFGSKLLVSALLDITYNNIYMLVIGKLFSAASLGNYSRANQFAQFPSSNITGIIQRVTFPVLSNIQNEDERLSINYRKLLRMSAFIIFPMMVCLSALAHPVVMTFLTEKWLNAVVFLQIICFSLMWYPIHAINLNLLKVKGRSDLFLRLEIIKKAIGIGVLCITIPMGLLPMCYGQIVTSLICLVVNIHYTGKIIHIGFFTQMRDILPTLIASLIMGGAVYLLLPFLGTAWMQLVGGLIIGSTLYLLIAYIFRFQEFAYIKEIIFKR